MLMAARRRKLYSYAPYPKQREFHAAGKLHRERLLSAGNRLGKSLSASMEVAMHLTGLYPEWWEGKRFPGPTRWWASGANADSTRDVPQALLFGDDLDSMLGTGSIPKDCIGKVDRAQGVRNAVSRATIKHVSGGWSTIWFKYYEQDQKQWMGQNLHGVWFDEEPPSKIYTEGLTRTNTTKGIALMTSTPLMGMTEVVCWFYPEPNTKDRHLTMMDITEVDHFDAEEIEKIISAYPPHEREARAKGVPMLGSGRVFPLPESDIAVPDFRLPDHFRQVVGIDFGWDHPTAAAHVAWDEDNDIHYLTKGYKQSEESPVVHARAIQRWGDWLPVVWPHDGWQHAGDTRSAMTTADQYRKEGLRMWPTHATFRDGGYGFEAGLMEMYDRMRTGRFKVFESVTPFFEEFRLYHRKDGKVVKERDDLICAARYAMMMARPGGASRRPPTSEAVVMTPSYDWAPGGQDYGA